MGNWKSKKSDTLAEKQIHDLLCATELSRDELLEWYNSFTKEYPDGRIPKSRFIMENMYSHGGDKAFWEYIFTVHDVDGDGYIDFKEFIISLSVVTKGSQEDKLRWAFKIYDVDGNGYIDETEMLNLLKCIFKILDKEQLQHEFKGDTPEQRCKRIFQKMDLDRDGKITMDEFIRGCKQDRALINALNMF